MGDQRAFFKRSVDWLLMAAIRTGNHPSVFSLERALSSFSMRKLTASLHTWSIAHWWSYLCKGVSLVVLVTIKTVFLGVAHDRHKQCKGIISLLNMVTSFGNVVSRYLKCSFLQLRICSILGGDERYQWN